MATKNEDKSVVATGAAASETGQRVQLNIRLQPVNQSDQPVFSNFSVVQGAPGMVFLDFGFLDPSVMPSVARLAKSGGKMPEAVNGRLATRVVLGIDAAAQLAQQLERHLRGLRARRPAASAEAESQPH